MKYLILSVLMLPALQLISCDSRSIESEGKTNVVEVADSKEGVTEEGKVIYLSKELFLEKVMNFEKNQSEWIYEGDKPCIIDFYAEWCGPCKKIAPIMEELAKEYKGDIYIYKIDTDKERELSSVFGIRSIPSVLFVPMNGQPKMSMGALPKESFVSEINTFLLNKEEK
ncbi:MAG: thioredoxin [Bacteroidales bacterium]|nr:thioredoxin [Bacteroidales bacterium]